MELSKFDWEDGLFTGLVYDKSTNTYLIIWGYSTIPKIDIEYSFDSLIATKEGKIETKIIEDNKHLFTMKVLQNQKEYGTAASLIRTLLGDKKWRITNL